MLAFVYVLGSGFRIQIKSASYSAPTQSASFSSDAISVAIEEVEIDCLERSARRLPETEVGIGMGRTKGGKRHCNKTNQDLESPLKDAETRRPPRELEVFNS